LDQIVAVSSNHIHQLQQQHFLIGEQVFVLSGDLPFRYDRTKYIEYRSLGTYTRLQLELEPYADLLQCNKGKSMLITIVTF
jgi:hypothetical protein